VLGQDHLAGEAALLAHRELELQAVADLIAALGTTLPPGGNSFIRAM
jgi:hypothetical protein